MVRGTTIALLVLVLVGCRKDGDAVDAGVAALFPLELPPGFPMPSTPADNPLTRASVELGKRLFFDPRLSRDGTVSCASCHLPGNAFADVAAVSEGVDGRLGFRNGPTLANVAYHTKGFFRDGGVPTLEQQVISPVHEPAEMDHDIHRAAETLRDLEPYASLSLRAYGKPLDGWVLTRAIANYQRTLVSGWSRWDRWMAGDHSALTESEVRGWELFNGAALNCTGCHSGFDLSDHDFHNVGQYTVYTDPGRERITLDPADNGKFKTPTLRNIALTAPYMHNGAFLTLDEVVDHFASGGHPHPALSKALRPFTLDPQGRTDLLAFLNALTDERPIDQVP
jgi:cytochrome c peroxidase